MLVAELLDHLLEFLGYLVNFEDLLALGNRGIHIFRSVEGLEGLHVKPKYLIVPQPPVDRNRGGGLAFIHFILHLLLLVMLSGLSNCFICCKGGESFIILFLEGLKVFSIMLIIFILVGRAQEMGNLVIGVADDRAPLGVLVQVIVDFEGVVILQVVPNILRVKD
jgi:hypothetical protein